MTRAFSDAEIRWPAVILSIPAAINMIQPSRMLKICPVDGKLVERVELSFQGVI